MKAAESQYANHLTIVLAGGQGERLYPLTRDRAKPAVPFGGTFRIIDFTLSNCLNSNFRKIEVLTQYKSMSLARHLRQAWNLFNYNLGEYINNSPPQQRLRKTWYQGTADAIYQNIYTLDRTKPKTVLILSGDHIYRMDYRKMLAFHQRKKADVTIGAFIVPKEEASAFGIIEKDEHDRVKGFQEKPKKPKTIPGDNAHSLVSMGIYIFDAEALVRRVSQDARSPNSSHDFGKDVIPGMVKRKDKVYVYSLGQESRKSHSYWRDVGSTDAYFDAHMDLLGDRPPFSLSDDAWPLHTATSLCSPPIIKSKSTLDHSIISNDCHIHQSEIINSILSPGVRVEKGCRITNSIILDHVTIKAGSHIDKTIIDKGVTVPGKSQLNAKNMSSKGGFTITRKGILVIPKEEPL